MKKLPNVITLIRMVLSLVLLLTEPFCISFYIVYTLCGLSDMLDGLLARRLHAESNLGAKLDSLSDGIFFICITISILPRIYLPAWTIWSIVLIFIIKMAAFVIGYVKFHEYAFLHTYANKLTGFSLFVMVYLLNYFEIATYLTVIIVAGVAAVEELLIQAGSSHLDRNVKSLFHSRQSSVS